MELPNDLAGNLTEMIMAKIKKHLIQEPPPQEAYHYNRVFEAVYQTIKDTLSAE